jgi:hypothetical protein
MLGLNAKIDGARAKRRPAFCSAGLSAQQLRLPARRSRRENYGVLSGHDFSHAAKAAKSKRLQPLRFVLFSTQAHTSARYLQLLRHSNPSFERQSRARLAAKTGQRSATGASKNVSVRTDLGLLFSATYRFFNCTLVSVRHRVAPPQSDPRQTAGAARPSGLPCRAAISNRDTKRLEMCVTRRKQTIPLSSNRDKTRVFQSAFQTLKSGDRRPKETDRAAR